jgi:hypothetical protein
MPTSKGYSRKAEMTRVNFDFNQRQKNTLRNTAGVLGVTNK